MLAFRLVKSQQVKARNQQAEAARASETACSSEMSRAGRKCLGNMWLVSYGLAGEMSSEKEFGAEISTSKPPR